MTSALYEFWMFGLKQAYACIFAGLFLGLVIATHFYYPFTSLHRYDFLFLAAICIQAGLLLFRLEGLAEFYTILLFHVVATIMEVFKTEVGSWSYPDPAVLHIGAVPLFAGFMYSAVGSYLARIWRIFTFRFTNFPRTSWLVAIAALIYLNFFTHHFIYDIRWLILLSIGVMLRGTSVHFTVTTVERRMHLLLGLSLVSLFIWFAENISTYCRVWYYPNQMHGWTVVSPTKLVAWFMLMFVSFTLIAVLYKNETSSDVAHRPNP